MLEYYFTKTLKGRLLNVFREIIMGWKHVSELEKLLPPRSKECVGKMYEVINTNFPFNKKSFVYDNIQKGQVK